MRRRQPMRADLDREARPFAGQSAPALRPPQTGRQHGQAMVETLVFTLAAVALLFAVLMIGRLHALQASAAGAARALAFECRLESAGCDDPARAADLAAAIRVRHLGWLDGEAVHSAMSGATSGQGTSLHPFWANPDGSRMVESLQSVSLSSTRSPLDAGVNVAAAVRRQLAAPGLPALSVGPQRFGLDAAAGLRVSQVEVPVRLSLSGSPAATGGSPLALRLKARLAVLGDEWNASHSLGAHESSVASRVERGSRLDPFLESALDAGYALTRGMLNAADALGLEPGAAALSAPRLDVTIIPQDRRQ